MKKIVLISLVTMSCGLLGNDLPKGQQPAHQAPRSLQGPVTQASGSRQAPRSPERPVVQTPGPRITQDAGRQLNEMFQRALIEAVYISPATHPLVRTTPGSRQVRPGNLRLNAQSRVNDDDTPGAPRSQNND